MVPGMKLIIQIPCYNEAETLEIALDSLPKHMDGIDEIEYLIIDDGSVDNTREVAVNWGVHYVVSLRRNKGLAKGFMAGIDACLEHGADIIVNTDADNQYCGEDIVKLVQPILDGRADIVIGERPIGEIQDFSPLKKRLQRLGSWAVRKASGTDVPDAPSGFRAFSREAALRLNVINDYTYTLETIVQAGRNRMAIMSVPVRTNPELRKSRLFNSMFGYIKKSVVTIVRAFAMYRPLAFFTVVGSIPFLSGFALGLRFLYYFFHGSASGHVQSLILAGTLLMMGFMTYIIGLQADIIAANRKILEDIQYHVKKQGVGYAVKDRGNGRNGGRDYGKRDGKSRREEQGRRSSGKDGRSDRPEDGRSRGENTDKGCKGWENKDSTGYSHRRSGGKGNSGGAEKGYEKKSDKEGGEGTVRGSSETAGKANREGAVRGSSEAAGNASKEGAGRGSSEAAGKGRREDAFRGSRERYGRGASDRGSRRGNSY